MRLKNNANRLALVHLITKNARGVNPLPLAGQAILLMWMSLFARML